MCQGGYFLNYRWDNGLINVAVRYSVSIYFRLQTKDTMADGKPVKVGTRVEVIGKGVVGSVAYVGSTLFSSGKWIGVVLDEAKGKNNGTVQGKSYFKCEDGHGIFVRQSQLTVLESQGGRPSIGGTPSSSSREASPGQSGIPAPRGIPTPTGIPTPGRPVPRAASMEDIAKQQETKKKNRLSMSGLKPPSAGRSTESLTSSQSGSGAATPRSKDASPTPDTGAAATPSPKPAAETPKGARTPAPKAAATPKKEEKKEDKAPASLAQTSVADIGALTTSIQGKMENLQQQQEIEGLKAEVKDLEEKLETLKVKRSEDKVKLKEFEKVKIQLQQLQEYKIKMQEQQQDLQRQLAAAKKEQRETQEAFDRYKDEMADLSETVEIATLDKEMAEEKCESLQAEVDSLKERVEEVTLDLQIMREDVSQAGTEGGPTNFQVKQLEQQNERLKEALVKLRDVSNMEKQEVARITKQVEKQQLELTSLGKERDRLKDELEKAQEQMLELQEHVDAAQGAEEMVEQLTEKTLQLEERLQEMEEEKLDLEAICEMNDELNENARESELELREEVDLANAHAAEAKRKLEAMTETIADYEGTIAKFRDLVAQLQESNRELRSKQESGTAPAQTTPTLEIFDFKSKFAETKAHAKAIDMELRKLDVTQANKHVFYLCSFMADSFIKRGGDHDAVLVLLLIPRLVAKLELLISQVREKFDVPEVIEREQVLKTHQSDAFSFSNKFIHMLCNLQAVLKQYESALDTCSVDLFLKIGTLLPELAVHEKSIDFFIELLRKDQLDETTNVESLDKSINYFKHLYSVHLSNEKVDCTNFMSDHTRSLLAACDCIHVELSRLKHALQSGQETSDISILLRDLENFNNEIKVAARKIKRRIPQADGPSTTPLSFSKEIQEQLLMVIEQIGRVVIAMQETSGSAMQQAQLLTDALGLPAKKLEELAYSASDKVYGKDDTGPYEILRSNITSVAGLIKQLATAMENGEYDYDGTQEKKPISPVTSRAMAVKAVISDTENMKLRLEKKEEDVIELKKQLKLKQEELSEQQVRMSLLEKKLENAGRDSDDRVDKLQRKLDEANIQLKQKEKEFDETMDALQADIDALEQEKTDLKMRLTALSKKTLLEGLSRQSSQSGIAALVAEAAAGEQSANLSRYFSCHGC
jgi:dynactin 1